MNQKAIAPEGTSLPADPRQEDTRGMSPHLAGPFNLTPRNLTEAIELAKLLAKTEVIPKEYIDKPGNILVAVQMGQELGLAPLQAVNSIAVINGRPSVWGDAMLAVIKRSGVLDPKFGEGGIKERLPAEALAAGEGECWVKRKDMAEPLRRTFSIEEAEQAGLIERAKGQRGNGPWINYPGRMLQMRARSWALRDSCPDVLKGLRTVEEERDQFMKEAEYQVLPPRRISSAPPVEKGDADNFISELGGGSPQGTPQRAGGGARLASKPGGGGGGGKSRRSGDEWKGRILNLTGPVTGNSNGTDWTRWRVEGEGGFKAAIFNDEYMADTAAGIRMSGKPAVITYQSGPKGNAVLSIEPAPSKTQTDDDGPPKGGEREPGQEG